MRKMQFINYWQQFEHTGRVEDYLNYLRSTEGTDFPNACRMRRIGVLAIRRTPACRTAGRKDVKA